MMKRFKCVYKSFDLYEQSKARIRKVKSIGLDVIVYFGQIRKYQENHVSLNLSLNSKSRWYYTYNLQNY